LTFAPGLDYFPHSLNFALIQAIILFIRDRENELRVARRAFSNNDRQRFERGYGG
jgi:hypothetical protein